MNWRQREETAQTWVTDGLFKEVTFELRLGEGATFEVWVKSIPNRETVSAKTKTGTA